MKKEEKEIQDLHDFVSNIENVKLNKPVPLQSGEIELISVFAAGYVADKKGGKCRRSVENVWYGKYKKLVRKENCPQSYLN